MTLDRSGAVAVATSESAATEFGKLAVANDTTGISQMVLAGQLFMAPQGTRVRVIERGFGRKRVRVLDGELAGRDGWVPSDWVR